MHNTLQNAIYSWEETNFAIHKSGEKKTYSGIYTTWKNF